MSCLHKASCPLYPQFRIKAILGFWITNYCDAGHERCARFVLAQKGKPVPINLLPNGDHLGAKMQ